MNDYVAKPVSPHALAGALDRWLPAIRAQTDEASGEPGRSTGPGRSTDPVRGSGLDPERTRIRDRLAEFVEDGDPDDLAFIRDFVGSFLTTADGMLDKLRAAVEERDLKSVRHWAHTLKGAAANVGSGRISELCASIERQVESDTAGGCRNELSGLREALSAAPAEFADAIADLVEGGSSPR